MGFWDTNVAIASVCPNLLLFMGFFGILVVEFFKGKDWVSPQAEYLSAMENSTANAESDQENKYVVSGDNTKKAAEKIEIKENENLQTPKGKENEPNVDKEKDVQNPPQVVKDEVKKIIDEKKENSSDKKDDLNPVGGHFNDLNEIKLDVKEEKPIESDSDKPINENEKKEGQEKEVEKRPEPSYKPYEPKSNLNIDKEFYTMWIREELHYYMMFHIICLGYALITWQSAFVAFMTWLHAICFVVYTVFRVKDTAWSFWILAGCFLINWILLICAMGKYTR